MQCKAFTSNLRPKPHSQLIFLKSQTSSHLNLTRDIIDRETWVKAAGVEMINMIEAEATRKEKDAMATNLPGVISVDSMNTTARNAGSDTLPIIQHMLTTI